MAIDLTSFTRQLTVLAAILFVSYILFYFVMPDRYTPKFHWAIVPFFYIIVLGSKYLLQHLAGAGEFKKFDLHFVNITMFRFFIYVTIVLIYAFRIPAEAIVFIITFFVFYFFFTIFEVVFLYRDLKKE